MLLSQLQKAFEPLTKLSQAEAKVEVAGVDVYLRLLSPDEELECQQEAQSLFSDDEEEDVDDIARTKAIQFLDTFRLGVLSRAIVQIGDNDLRGVSVVETGEVLDNGVSIKVTKVQAVRTIVESFPRSIQVRLMQEFHILTESVSQVVEKAIIGEYSASEAEIEDLENRIKEIKQGDAVINSSLDENIRQTMRTAKTVGDGFVGQRLSSAEDIEEKQKQKEKEKQEEIIAETKTPPVEEQKPNVEMKEEAQVRQPIRPQYAPPPQKTEPEVSSQPTQKEGKKETQPPNIYQEQQMPKRAKPADLKDGVEVYRLPPSEVGGSAVQQQKEAPVNPSRNPRFRSPNK